MIACKTRGTPCWHAPWVYANRWKRPPTTSVIREQAVRYTTLQAESGEAILLVMRRSLQPRSRVFRCLLMLALIAWTAFAFEAMAHPLVMNGQMENMANPTTGQATSPHCKGMASAHFAPGASTPAPSHPGEAGHGCCAFGHCDCASFCSSVAGVPSLVMTWPPLHDPLLGPVHVGVLPATFGPRLRPPIV